MVIHVYSTNCVKSFFLYFLGCGNVAEVALVIDVSQSIDDTELGQMISFVKGLVTALEPSPEGIRIAAVKYNTLVSSNIVRISLSS